MLFSYEPIILIYLIPVVLLSLTFHEFSHAYVSFRLGDPTARNMGRLTLNPVKHLDILGSLMFLFARFGWAKPVPINPMYYKNRKRGTMLVSLAGPLSNILLALIFAIPMIYLENKFWLMRGILYNSTRIEAVTYNLSFLFYYINVGLAVFNIIPVPPLDGSKILGGILPSRYYYKMLEYQNYLSVGFLLIMFMFPRVLNTIMSPLIWVVETAITTIVEPVLKLF